MMPAELTEIVLFSGKTKIYASQCTKKQQCPSCRKDANAFFLFVSLMQKCVCRDSDKWQHLLKQQDHQVLTTSLQVG